MKKRLLSLALALVISLSLLPTAALAAETATPSASKVLVNGSAVAFEAYTIKSNNYFKLRDLAMALNGTAKSFEVGWDGPNNAVTMTTGKPYTPQGKELTPGDGAAKSATRSTAALFLNGERLYLTAYVIGGNNYYKLRDVMEKLDVAVGWDGPQNLITVDTAGSYVRPAAQTNSDAILDGVVEGDWYYFIDPSTKEMHPKTQLGSHGAHLVKIKTDGTGYQVLSKDFCNAPMIYGDWIYYIRKTSTSGWLNGSDSELYRVKKDGTGRQKITKFFSPLPMEALFVGEKLYLSVGQTGAVGLYSMNPDGSNQKLIFDDIITSLHYWDGRIYGVCSFGLGQTGYQAMGGWEAQKYKQTVWSIKTDGTDRRQVTPYGVFANNKAGVFYDDKEEWVYYSEHPVLAGEEVRDTLPSNALCRVRYDGTDRQMLYVEQPQMRVFSGDWIYFSTTLPDRTYMGSLGIGHNEFALFRMLKDGTKMEFVIVKPYGDLLVRDGMIYNSVKYDPGNRTGSMLVYDGVQWKWEQLPGCAPAPGPSGVHAYPNNPTGPILEKPQHILPIDPSTPWDGESIGQAVAVPEAGKEYHIANDVENDSGLGKVWGKEKSLTFTSAETLVFQWEASSETGWYKLRYTGKENVYLNEKAALVSGADDKAQLFTLERAEKKNAYFIKSYNGLYLHQTSRGTAGSTTSTGNSSPLYFIPGVGAPEPAKPDPNKVTLADGWYHVALMDVPLNIVGYSGEVELLKSAKDVKFRLTRKGDNEYAIQTEDGKYIAPGEAYGGAPGARLETSSTEFTWIFYNEKYDQHSLRPSNDKGKIACVHSGANNDTTLLEIWNYSETKAVDYYGKFTFTPVK